MSNTNTTTPTAKTTEFMAIYKKLTPHSKHRAWRMACKLTRKQATAKK